MQGSMYNTERGMAGGDARLSGVGALRRLWAGVGQRLTWRGFLCSIALPLAWLLWFYAFVVRVRFSLGRWPDFGEPLDRSLVFHDESIRRVAGLLGCSLIPAAGLALGCLIFRRSRHVSIYLVCYAMAVLAGYGAVLLAPGPFLNWFFD